MVLLYARTYTSSPASNLSRAFPTEKAGSEKYSNKTGKSLLLSGKGPLGKSNEQLMDSRKRFSRMINGC